MGLVVDAGAAGGWLYSRAAGPPGTAAHKGRGMREGGWEWRYAGTAIDRDGEVAAAVWQPGMATSGGGNSVGWF